MKCSDQSIGAVPTSQSTAAWYCPRTGKELLISRHAAKLTRSAFSPRFKDQFASIDMVCSELLRCGCRADAATRVRAYVGRTAIAIAGIPLKESKLYRDKCVQLLKRCRASWILRDVRQRMPVRIVRTAEYLACRWACTFVVCVYKLKGKIRK